MNDAFSPPHRVSIVEFLTLSNVIGNSNLLELGGVFGLAGIVISISSVVKCGRLSGEGARLVGGRWNLPGTPLVYASETLSLASLETFVHVQPVDRRIRYVWFRVVIPANVLIDAPESLAKEWREAPPGEATQLLGSQWVEQNNAAVLRVPSMLVPGEYNLLLNPAHAHFKRLKISTPHSFAK